MNLRRLAGIIFLASFGANLLSFSTVPSDLYRSGFDVDERLAMVEANRLGFIAGAVLTSTGAIGMALGYIVLSRQLRATENALMANLGAAAILLGSLVVAALVLQGIADPRAYLEIATPGRASESFYFNAFAWLSLAGQFLFGLVFLRGDFPRWLAYATLGAAVLVLLAVVLVGEPAAAELIIFIMPPVVGLALLRQAKKGSG